MKNLLTAVIAAAILTSGAAFADDQAPSKKAVKVKPKIALLIEGKVHKEVSPTKETEKAGIGTDYTFEWSGGYGDIIITGPGAD